MVGLHKTWVARLPGPRRGVAQIESEEISGAIAEPCPNRKIVIFNRKPRDAGTRLAACLMGFGGHTEIVKTYTLSYTYRFNLRENYNIINYLSYISPDSKSGVHSVRSKDGAARSCWRAWWPTRGAPCETSSQGPFSETAPALPPHREIGDRRGR